MYSNFYFVQISRIDKYINTYAREFLTMFIFVNICTKQNRIFRKRDYIDKEYLQFEVSLRSNYLLMYSLLSENHNYTYDILKLNE